MILIPILLAFLALALFLTAHVIAWRTLPAPRKNVFVMALLAAVAYCLMMVIAHRVFGLRVLGHVPLSGPVYAFLIVCYFHFYFGVDRSVSMRTLGVLAQAKEGRLTLDELNAFYPKEEMIRRRLDIMIENGWLIEKDGLFYCTPKARRLVRFALLGRKIYRLDAAG